MVCLFHLQKREQVREPHQPDECPDELDEPEQPEGFPIPDDTSHWDVFIPDDDEIDPLPEPDDFWIEPDEQRVNEVRPAS